MTIKFLPQKKKERKEEGGGAEREVEREEGKEGGRE